MAKDTVAAPGKNPKTNQPEEEVTPGWEKIVYAPERVAKWIRGEITLQELNAISGPEMLEMAVIGFSMYEQGKYEEAKVIFHGLCGLDPKEGYYRTALGAVYLAQDDLKTAEALFNEAIRLNDKEIASYVNRGEVYLRQGKIIEAAKDFKKAVELDPENKDPLSQRARLLAAAALETIEATQKESKGGKAAAAKKK
jgi:tetratricopeptide (TPR) repeat protein